MLICLPRFVFRFQERDLEDWPQSDRRIFVADSVAVLSKYLVCASVLGYGSLLCNCSGSLPPNFTITGVNLFAMIATLEMGVGQTANCAIYNDCSNPIIVGAGWNAAWTVAGANHLTVTGQINGTATTFCDIEYQSSNGVVFCPPSSLSRKPDTSQQHLQYIK